MYHRLKALFKGPSVRQWPKVAAKLSALLFRIREVLARTQTSSTASRQTVLAHARIYLHTSVSFHILCNAAYHSTMQKAGT